MAILDVTDLHWNRFANPRRTYHREELLKAVVDPREGYLRGLAFFQRREDASTAALKERRLKLCGDALQLRQELIDNACAVSTALNLHAYQAYRLVEFVVAEHPTLSSAAIRSQAQRVYYDERLALLSAIRRILRHHVARKTVSEPYLAVYHGCIEETREAELDATVATLHSKGLIGKLVQEMVEHLKGIQTKGGRPPAPLTGDHRELEHLVDIMMYSFRRKCCAFAQIVDICSCLKQLPENCISIQLVIKLALLPMLGYGLWKLLEVRRVDEHPLYDDFRQLNNFFKDWNLEGGTLGSYLLHEGWALFEKKLMSLPIPPPDFVRFGLASEEGGSTVPQGMMRVLTEMGNIGEEPMVRECLLIMVTASIDTSVILQEKSTTLIALKAIAEICNGNYIVFHSLICSPTHVLLNDLLREVVGCINISPLYAMTLLKGICSQDLAGSFVGALSDNSYGVVVIHAHQDLQCIDSDHGNVTFRAHSYISPAFGFQIPIPQGSQGERYQGLCQNWIARCPEDCTVIRWTAHKFGKMFIFAYIRCVALLSSDDPYTRQAVLTEVLSMVQFAVAYMDVTTPDIYNRVLPFKQYNQQSGKSTTLVKDTVFLVEAFLREGEDISPVVRLLKHLCQQNPKDVIDSLMTSAFFNGSGEPKWSVEEVLARAGTQQSPDTFIQAEAVISLLAEFVEQTFIFESLQNWLHIIFRTLLARLKRPVEATCQAAKAGLMRAILDLLHQTLLLGSDSLLAPKLYEGILEGFVIEDCIQGILKSLPVHRDQLQEHELQLITAACTFLADFLSEELQLAPPLVIKALKYLLTSDYWDGIPPGAKLALFVEISSPASDSVASACAAAALRFFSALLNQFETHKGALEGFELEKAIPMKGAEPDPEFLNGVLLRHFYSGHTMSMNRIQGAFDLFVTACRRNSSFVGQMTFPSTLRADSTSQRSSLMDLSWRFVSQHESVFSCQPSVLCHALRGMRAVQKSQKGIHDGVWNILRGQNAFHRTLLEVALKMPPSSEDQGDIPEVERFRQIHEQCQGLALEILCGELDQEANNGLTDLLGDVLEGHWVEWTHLLEHATALPSDDFLAAFMLWANCLAFEILAAVAPDGRAHGASIPWLDQLQQVVGEVLSRSGVEIFNVANYIRSILEPIEQTECDMSARMMLLKTPTGPFDFLAAEVQPVKVLLEHLLKAIPTWKLERIDLTASPERLNLLKSLPECVTSNCLSYVPFMKSLSSYLKYVSSLSIMAQLTASWRHLTQSMFANAPQGSCVAQQNLIRLMTSVANRCVDWTMCSQSLLNDVSSRVKSQAVVAKLPLMQQDLFCSVQFTAELAASLVDLANLAPRFKQSARAPPRVSSSPAPFHRRPPSGVEEEEPVLPEYQLIDALGFWFQSFSAWEMCPSAQAYKPAVEKTTQNLILISRPILPKLDAVHDSRKMVQQYFLSAILLTANPDTLGFLTANAALRAIAQWTGLTPGFTAESIVLLYQKLKLDQLLQIAAHRVHHLIIDSSNPEEDREYEHWSKNLLKLCSSLMQQAHLRAYVTQPQILEELWNYMIALMSPTGAALACRDEGPIYHRHLDHQEAPKGVSRAVEFVKDAHIRKAYKMDGSPNPAFQQWCLLLTVVGDVVYLQKDEEGNAILRFYQRCATMLFLSLDHYIHADFGTYWQPLTLERIYRMESSLRFLVKTHDVFSKSAALMPKYDDVRATVLKFLKACYSILSRPDREIICPPVSAEEKEMDQQPMAFDSDLGWFHVCKLGAHRVWFPEAEQTPFGERAALTVHKPSNVPRPTYLLTHYSWRISKGLYSCIGLSLEYLRASVKPHLKKELDAEQIAFRDMMWALQTDVTGLGTWLTNAKASENEGTRLWNEIKDLAKIAVTIANVAEEFLSEWGQHRRRREQEVLNSHMDTLRHLLDDPSSYA